MHAHAYDLSTIIRSPTMTCAWAVPWWECKDVRGKELLREYLANFRLVEPVYDPNWVRRNYQCSALWALYLSLAGRPLKYGQFEGTVNLPLGRCGGVIYAADCVCIDA